MAANAVPPTARVELPAPGPMTITDAAREKIEGFARSAEEFQGKVFRVFVEGGGCSGLRYAFVFDDPRDGDFWWTLGEVTCALDPISYQYLRGATVDYVEDARGAGFIVDNPNAPTACSCSCSC